MDLLGQEFPGNDNYTHMKVVVLPGKGDPGGPPNVVEIEQIENRYQLQSDGKSEYYGFDRALSMKRKIELGLSLEEQIRDNPQFAGATASQIQKAVKEYTRDYLEPLKCVDRYLKHFGRDGLYRTVSSGISDREGRWQAFIDYAATYARDFCSPKRRIELGIEEDEVGAIEEAAFYLIRLRDIPNMPKVHAVMREIGKYCSTEEGKREVLRIADDVQPKLPASQCVDPDGKALTTEEIDAKWAAAHKQAITYRINKARTNYDTKKQSETPLDLLEAAHKKLTHENMDVGAIAPADYAKARKMAASIKNRANELETEIFYQEKQGKKASGKAT